MATYNFATITADQALAYDAAHDSLAIPLEDSLYDFVVSFDDAAGTVRLNDVDGHHAVVFGSGIYNELIIAAGGTAMHIGSPGSDLLSFATIQYGGAGADTIAGGTYAFGGPGADIFVATYSSQIETIRDWEPGDTLYMSATTPTAANYVEATAADKDAAFIFATQQLQGDKEYVVVAVGSDLYVYADFLNVPGVTALSRTQIVGRGLGDISLSNFIGGRDPTAPPPPPPPSGATGLISGNLDNAHLSHLLGLPISAAGSADLILGGFANGLTLHGSGFTYDSNDQLTGGTVTHITYVDPIGSPTNNPVRADLTVLNVSATPFGGWVATDATQTAFQTILAGNDNLHGAFSSADLIRGYDGNDLIYGEGGSDTIFGGTGDDTIYAVAPPGIELLPSPAQTYLRGDEGNDSITGADGFDDINGNMGNDTIHGNGGDDYSVGGKDNDLLFGDDGNDIVWGNLGNDTCDGGNGADQVRGGQGDDSVSGGAGNDFVSGDRGNDTISGGTGADVFHGSQDAGIDRVLDFHPSEGDRVQLDPGTIYTVTQVGADTVIDMGPSAGGPNQMILVGVQLSTLTPGWIFGA